MKTSSYQSFYVLLLSLLAISGGRTPSRAETPIYSFAFFDRVEHAPIGKLFQAADGNLYGTVSRGGDYSAGGIFQISTTGVFAFADWFDNYQNGNSPQGGLTRASNGTLYGTTYDGGAYASGTIYKTGLSYGTDEVLHEFDGYSEGMFPCGELIQGSDGNFYGTTSAGGIGNGGTIYQLNSGTGNVTVIHTFTGGSSDGARPMAGLAEGSDGYLYGTCSFGGAFGGGTVFKTNKSGTLYQTLHDFNDNNVDGTGPHCALVKDPSGNLYGTCRFGGFWGFGTIFKITPSGVYTVLHAFTGYSGDECKTGLVRASDGYLYGTTSRGGTYGYGTAFKISTAGAFAILRHFNGLDVNDTDYYTSSSPLIQGKDGNLYGVSEQGGQGLGGTVFKLTRTGTLTVLKTFPGADGTAPNAGLIQASDGQFYGVTPTGGAYGGGTVYRSTGATYGPITYLHHFDDRLKEGTKPLAGLTQGKDGNFFGTCSEGGLYGHGTVFKMTSAGVVTVLHHFQPVFEGGTPRSRLLQGADGNFYGTCYEGGNGNYGSVFKVSSTGAFAILHYFSWQDGRSPRGALVQDSTGSLYGVTEWGGAFGYGTLYKLSTTGVYTRLYSFDSSGPFDPIGGLVLPGDGYLYGTTSNGGTYSSGTVFRLSSTNVLTVLHSFGNGTDGSYPMGDLTLGPDGNLYGTVSQGTASSGGSGFRISRTGTGFTYFPFNYDYTIESGLCLGSDCRFYGASSIGGPWYGGEAFQADTSLHYIWDVSGSVSVTKPTPTLVGGVYQATLAIKNIGTRTILGPMHIVLNGLPAASTFVNRTGTVPSGYPTVGSPYRTVPGNNNNNILALGPGKSLTLVVQFSTNVGTAYTVNTYTGRF